MRRRRWVPLPVLVWRRRFRTASPRNGSPLHERRALGFLSGERPSRAQYGELFDYFVEGFVRHRTPGGGRARYPGWPSRHGRDCDEIEGFSRIAPLIAAWLHHGRPAERVLSDGSRVDLVELIRRGFVAGTDPSSPDYWGTIDNNDQRIVEAADVALALWLAKDRLWPRLGNQERAAIATWLRGVARKRTHDNNWHLFVALTHAVLADLGVGTAPSELGERYARLKSFHRGGGWFSDGPVDRFDYYNAWGFHYGFFWLDRIRPDLDPDFLRGARRSFVADLKHFFGPNGFPVMGRSVCYRMAAPAPLILAQLTDPDVVSPGQARRALDLTWRGFVRRGAVRGGQVTQGYGAADRRVVDYYIGPAGCLWSLRSLVAAFFVPDHAAFWASAGEVLPVEERSFRLEIPATGWTLLGDRSVGEVTLHTSPRSRATVRPDRLRVALELAGGALGRSDRLISDIERYGRKSYGSSQPYCGYGDPQSE